MVVPTPVGVRAQGRFIAYLDDRRKTVQRRPVKATQTMFPNKEPAGFALRNEGTGTLDRSSVISDNSVLTE
jgi:hypothetical protein